jgi:hypothetical protein
VELVELCAVIGSSVTVTDVASHLLRFVFEYGAEEERDGSFDYACAIAQDFSHMVVDGGHDVSEWASDDLRSWLVAELRAVPDTVDRAEVARHLADVCDELWGARYAGTFRDRGPLRIEDGTVFPVVYADLPKIVQGRLDSPPWAFPSGPHWTRRLRIADQMPHDLEVWLDPGHHDLLPAFADLGSIATVHPNASYDEIDVPQDPDGSFFGVRPRDEAEQRERLRGLVEKAIEEGAAVTVLPELCVTPELVDELRAVIAAGGRGLFVLGSAHVEEPGGARVNATHVIVAPDREVIVHRKLFPLKRPRERLHPRQRRLQILQGDDLCLGVCICRDLLAREVIGAFWLLGCNLVLVPAMTEDVKRFEPAIEVLVQHNQAIVAVANNPAVWDGERTGQAAFGQPTLGPVRFQIHDQPGVAVLDVARGLIEWHSLTGDPGPSGTGAQAVPDP